MESARPDKRIADLAARQHGIATAGQLTAAGLSQPGIARRVAAGRLHRVHRGVYAVGHKGLSNEGRWMAAVLACGSGAVLSHRSAAELWQLLKPRSGAVTVTAPTAAGRKRRDGITLHRLPSLPNPATTRRDGIAVTTVARTLADLSGHDFRRATRQAEFLGYPTGFTTDGTRSDLETAFLRLCRHHRLPMPEVNVRIAGFTVDFLWREQRLVVETDGYAAHRGRQAFLDDRARELTLAANGLRVRRFSDEQIEHQAPAVAAAICTELGA